MTILGGPQPANFASNQSAPRTIAEADFEAEVLHSELPVLVEFSSERSAVCRELDGVLAEVQHELNDKARVFKLDVDRSPFLTRQLRVQQVPTFLVMAGGRPVDMQAGALSKKQILAMLEPHLPRAAGAFKAEEVFALLKKGGMIAVVDTREPAAFERAHLPSAVNMPLEGLQERVAELYMLGGQPVLYCRAGDRSREFCQQMASAGVELGHLEGGLLGWEAEGFPIER